MTTNGPFIDAARAEAERMFQDGVNRTYNIAMKEGRAGFIAGARWARTHLAVEVRKAQAEALRETADWWAANPDDDAFETDGDTRNWLRDVATEYETGGSDEHR